MKTAHSAPSTSLTPLVIAWLGLVALTGLSLWLAQWSGRAAWLQLPVAAIVWFKGWTVARFFIETHLAHPFIAGVVRAFIICVPLALVLTVWIGERMAR